MRQGAVWDVLLKQNAGDELRIVAACEVPDGTMLVEERTDGELTFLTYGTLTCVRGVTVASEEAERLALALVPQEEDPAHALEVFFADEDRFLSDLQDALDTCGVPYTYTVTCGNDYALRRCAG